MKFNDSVMSLSLSKYMSSFHKGKALLSAIYALFGKELIISKMRRTDLESQFPVYNILQAFFLLITYYLFLITMGALKRPLTHFREVKFDMQQVSSALFAFFAPCLQQPWLP